MSMFGGGGAFGSTNTAGTGGGLFGSNPQQQQGQQQQQQPAGGLFGGTTGTTGGGLFGNTNTNTGMTGTAQPLQAQPTQPATAFGATNPNTNTNTGGGLFGSTTNAGGTGGGLFGSTSTNPGNAGGGLFGNPQNNPATGGGGGMFGNTSATNTTGGGLFGNTNTATNTNTNTAGGGLFGNNAAGTTGGAGGGLFGSSNNPAMGTSGGGLFGSTTNTTNNAGGGLFGSNTQQNNAGGGGLFGSTNTNTGGGLFGAAKPAGTGLFGSTTGTTSGGGLFCSTNAQQQQQQQQQQQGGGLFGQSTLGVSALGNTLRPAMSTTQTTDAQNQYIRMTEKIEMVYKAWNPDSPQCRFQHAFYNLVDPRQVGLYGRPANAKDDAVWEKAVRENPDPSCFVPVIAIGFDDIRSRVEAQSTQATDQSQKLTDLKKRLSNLESRHSVSNVARLQRAIATQTQITHRLLKMLQHLHLLIPAVRSSAIRPEEEALRTRLEEIEDELRKGRVKSKVNELWALVGAVSAGVERGSRGTGGEWAVVDEEGMAQIVQVLKDQQTGLAYLTKVLQKAKADMAIVLGQNPNEELTLPEEENLWGSTSTLRASALR